MAPSSNFAILFIAAGLVMISVFFFTSSPFDITNLVLGAVPIGLLLCFGFIIWKARRRPDVGEEKTGKGGD